MFRHLTVSIGVFLAVMMLPSAVGAIEITPPEIGATTLEVTGYTLPEDFPDSAKMVNPFAGFLTLVHAHWDGDRTMVNIHHLNPTDLGALFNLFNAVAASDAFVALDVWTGDIVVFTAAKSRADTADPFTVEGFEAGSTEIVISGIEPGTQLTSIYTTPGRWPTQSMMIDGSWGDQDGEANGTIVTGPLRRTGPEYVLPGEIWALVVEGDQTPAAVTVEAEGTLARHVVPAVSHIVGSSGVPFISDLTLSNPVGFPISGWVRFLEEGVILEEGVTLENAPSTDFTLEPGESKTWTDVLESAFDITANVKGSLVVGGYPHWLLQVSSRNCAVDQEDRRFGIALPGQPTLTTAVGPNPWIMPGLVQNDEFRTNLLLAGAAPMTSTVTIRIIEDGVVKAEATREVPPYALVQINRVALTLGAGPIEDGHIELTVEEGGVAAAISVVDGSADDAAYIVARPMFP